MIILSYENWKFFLKYWCFILYVFQDIGAVSFRDCQQAAHELHATCKTVLFGSVEGHWFVWSLHGLVGMSLPSLLLSISWLGTRAPLSHGMGTLSSPSGGFLAGPPLPSRRPACSLHTSSLMNKVTSAVKFTAVSPRPVSCHSGSVAGVLLSMLKTLGLIHIHFSFNWNPTVGHV